MFSKSLCLRVLLFRFMPKWCVETIFVRRIEFFENMFSWYKYTENPANSGHLRNHTQVFAADRCAIQSIYILIMDFILGISIYFANVTIILLILFSFKTGLSFKKYQLNVVMHAYLIDTVFFFLISLSTTGSITG